MHQRGRNLRPWSSTTDPNCVACTRAASTEMRAVDYSVGPSRHRYGGLPRGPRLCRCKQARDDKKTSLSAGVAIVVRACSSFIAIRINLRSRDSRKDVNGIIVGQRLNSLVYLLHLQDVFPRQAKLFVKEKEGPQKV